MAYNFYLKSVLLPVTPSKLDIKINNNNKTYDLINEGEVNVIKKAGLTDIDFDVLLPSTKYPFATYDGLFKKPDYYLNFLERLKKSNAPFQFIVTRTLPNGKVLFNTNIKVSLEDYKIKEDAGEGMDVIVSISLKQYKSYGTKKVKIKKKKAKKSKSRFFIIKAIGIYVVKKSDTLKTISKKVYGKSSEWKRIYNANKKKMPNSYKLKVGTKLTIPELKTKG